MTMLTRALSGARRGLVALTVFGVAAAVPALGADAVVSTIVEPVRAASTPVGIYLSAGAHLPGEAGTFWMTDVEIHNAGSEQLEYEIALLRRDNDNSNPETKTYTIEPGTAVRFEDALVSVFGFTGAAALRITPSAPAAALGDAAAQGSAYWDTFYVTSRTFNIRLGDMMPGDGARSLADGAGGTFGQFVAGVWSTAGISEIDEGRLPQLSHTYGTTAMGFRTNIGCVNVTDQTITVEVVLYSADGTQLGTVDVELDPFEYRQVDKIFEQVTTSDVDDGFAVVRLKSGIGRFLAYASVVDNLTGDAIYIPAIWRPRSGGPPTFSSITFGTGTDTSGDLTGVGTSFPAGTDEIWLQFTYTGLTAGDTYTVNWYANNVLSSTYESTAYGATGRVTTSRSVSIGYATGTHRVDIVYKGALATSGEFTVGQ